MKLSASDTLQNLTGRNISDYLVKTYAQIIGKRWHSTNIQKYYRSYTEVLHIIYRSTAGDTQMYNRLRRKRSNSCLDFCFTVWKTKCGWMNSGQSFSFSSVLILETTNSVVSRFSLFFSLQVRRLLIGCQEHSGSPTSQWDRRRNRTSQKDLRAAEGQSEMLRLFPLCIWVPAFNNQSGEVSDEKKGQSVCQWFGQSNWRGSFKQETGHVLSLPSLKNVTILMRSYCEGLWKLWAAGDWM